MMSDLAVIRRLLAITFVVGSAGTGAELLLLEHTEGVWQKAPLVLIAAGCIAAGLLAARPGAALLRLFRLTMGVFVAAGMAGVVLHYRGNVEFERELRPGIAGMELFREAMTGATPALAPGTMILLGAIGLTYSYRHPAATERGVATPA